VLFIQGFPFGARAEGPIHTQRAIGGAGKKEEMPGPAKPPKSMARTRWNKESKKHGNDFDEVASEEHANDAEAVVSVMQPMTNIGSLIYKPPPMVLRK
jgi:hypothetical protein